MKPPRPQKFHWRTEEAKTPAARLRQLLDSPPPPRTVSLSLFIAFFVFSAAGWAMTGLLVNSVAPAALLFETAGLLFLLAAAITFRNLMAYNQYVSEVRSAAFGLVHSAIDVPSTTRIQLLTQCVHTLNSVQAYDDAAEVDLELDSAAGELPARQETPAPPSTPAALRRATD